MEIKTKKKVKAMVSLLLSLNILATPFSPIFAMGTALEGDSEALNNTETNEETENFSSEDSLVQNDFSSEMAPTESDFLQMDLDAEVPAEDNFFQTVRPESDFLETTSPQNTPEQGLEDPASTPSPQNDEPESGLTLTEWNYTEENGGIVLDSLKDNNAKNVVVPGEFTDAPGKQVYIKDSSTRYPYSSTSLEFREIDGKKVKVSNGSLYEGFRSLGLINFNGSGLDTSGVTTMLDMFDGCNDLTTITGMENWDTSDVYSMKEMFCRCENLENIDGLGSFDISDVEIMEAMFQSCQKLSTLAGLSGPGFKNMPKLYSIKFMFRDCTNLKDISALKNWDTSGVTNMSDMFSYCYTLSDISPLEDWDTSSVTDMSGMFLCCDNLHFADLSNWNLSKVTNIGSMFYTSSSPYPDGVPLLVIDKDEKFKDYDYSGSNRTPVGPTFDANGGKFPESAEGEADISTQAEGETPAEGSEIKQGKTTNWLANNTTAVDEFINTAIEQPTRDDGLVFSGWEAQDLPENPNAYDRMTATYKAKWGQININANDKEIEQGQAFDPLDGVTATDGNGDPIPAEQITVISNDVDVNKLGDYSVTYEAADSYGNTAQKTITVTVTEKMQVIEPNQNDSNSSNEEEYNWLKTGNSEQIDKFAWIMLLSLGTIVKFRRKKDE